MSLLILRSRSSSAGIKVLAACSRSRSAIHLPSVASAAAIDAGLARTVGITAGCTAPLPDLLASVLEDLAQLCRKTGRVPEAERLEERAKEVRDSEAGGPGRTTR